MIKCNVMHGWDHDDGSITMIVILVDENITSLERIYAKTPDAAAMQAMERATARHRKTMMEKKTWQ
jgi:hypothetical protein